MPSSDLRTKLGTLSDLGHALGLLGWDQQTHMPAEGAPARGEAMATIEGLHHDLLVAPELGALLKAARTDPDEPLGEALADVVGHDHERATRVPSALASEMARAAADAQEPWARARTASDFSIFRDALARNIDLRRQLAACFDDVEHPYDALLDNFEPGATTAEVSAVFAKLRDGLVPLIKRIAAAEQPAALPAPFDVDSQQTFALDVVRSWGYGDGAWRFDQSVHPFCESLSTDDVRVTGRFEDSSLTGLFAVMHEVGHGLYEHQIDPLLARTTLGTGVSMGIHESQSRLWENVVGRSEPFWRHWYPRLQRDLAALGDVPLDTFLKMVNRVEPSLIRVTADEVTYSMHVILRFELEVALIEGSLEVDDVPAAWNAKMEELLGIEVPDDANGCLQDIHWSFGELGYFPTYALGNIVAAQLWNAVRVAVPDLDDRIAEGDVAPLREWLREHVHRFGRTRSPAQIMLDATGGPLDPQPLIDQLTTKYTALYEL